MTSHDIVVNEETEVPQPNPSAIMVLSLVGGAGLILMILALGIGVVQGDAADGSIIGLTFVGGLVLLVLGIGGWLALVQPFKHFDDINEPHFTGHHDHAETEQEAAAEAEGVAIIPHEESV